ncbi:DNA cytosine methyltransferase [Subtercola sp. YIM 133946]|uniref:DNA cytosine methyltransferase n=1 Tax=Subtercola sp. YIM 133946 TaxID=3118909 RepID=UPI002F93B4C8
MSAITVTDLFCGAGGSTTGAVQVPGVHVRIAANHFKIVTDIHALNHPDTDHAVVDLHLERPSFFPKTDMLWASPECTKWSQANGSKMPAIDEGLFEDPLSDDAKTRSRLLMFDVLRFIEYHRYRLVIVENVVDIATQAQYRTAWAIWRQELRALGYEFRVLSLNSMHAQLLGTPAPQSRDRIYIVAWPAGAKAPDLERVVQPRAYCDRCCVTVESVQSFKPNRSVGRYRQAYVYCCPRCGSIVEPGWLPAAAAIDWSIPGERVGDRLKPKTRARIAAGIARYCGPLHIEAAGNTYDAADPNHLHYGDPDAYYRAWPMSEPLKSLHTTNSKGLAVPVEGRAGVDARTVDAPFRTLTTRAETAFVAEMYGTSTARPVTEPAGTFTAGGNHHALVQPLVASYHQDRVDMSDPSTDYLPTTTAGGIHQALVQSYYGGTTEARPVTDPVGTLTTVDRYALIHRNNTGGAEMTTPATEALRTLTTAGHQALIHAGTPTGRPRVSPADLKAAEEMVPDVLFRMFQPHEVAAGMAFPADYKWQPPDRAKPISNRDLVKAAGNAVTPPCSRDIIGVCVESLGYDVELAA